mmetsp:Transcript_283/g.623  ORF Transcript_283/g.623 Transcript_283/m.623 type:complete len:326 (-) Transcript_283:1494-2471(-)
MTIDKNQKPILEVDRGSLIQFSLTTLPLLALLIYFLFDAHKRPSEPIYNLEQGYTEYQWELAAAETGKLVRLQDMLTVFLSIFVCWTTFTVYMVYFVPKRRYLIGRYLSEGKEIVGDIHFDRTSRMCGRFNDYGYAIYAHPDKDDGTVVRKRVRVYQGYTREKVAILVLPNKPLSGQSKVDMEIDLLAATKDRDSKNKFISFVAIFWVVFTLIGSCYILIQMKVVQDPSDSFSTGIKIFLIMVGLALPFAFGMNWARFLSYRNWMVNRGAQASTMAEAKSPHGCLVKAPSEDGSDFVPYSIMNEDECSYLGSIPDHTKAKPWTKV